MATKPDYGCILEALGRDDPRERLATITFKPDGRYQTVEVNYNRLHQDVAESIRAELSGVCLDELPTLICAWGKCRVGSTALMSVFSIAGLTAYYQPIKTKAR